MLSRSLLIVSFSFWAMCSCESSTEERQALLAKQSQEFAKKTGKQKIALRFLKRTNAAPFVFQASQAEWIGPAERKKIKTEIFSLKPSSKVQTARLSFELKPKEAHEWIQGLSSPKLLKFLSGQAKVPLTLDVITKKNIPFNIDYVRIYVSIEQTSVSVRSAKKN